MGLWSEAQGEASGQHQGKERKHQARIAGTVLALTQRRSCSTAALDGYFIRVADAVCATTDAGAATGHRTTGDRHRVEDLRLAARVN